MTDQAGFRRPHLLIVSDDQELTRFLSEGLLIAGFWTSVIASAIQTIEVFRLRAFDLVIVDAALEGLGARELVRRLLGSSSPVTDRPVIMIAGSEDEISVVESRQLGAERLVLPPIEIDDLAIDLFAMVSNWRTLHPDALWADEAAQLGGQS